MNKNVKNLLIIGSSLTAGVLIYSLVKKNYIKKKTIVLNDNNNVDEYKENELLNYENSKIKRKYIRLN